MEASVNQEVSVGSSQAVTVKSLGERLCDKIEELRPLFKEYQLLSDDQQKATRHYMYTKTGEFGKAMKEMFQPFANYEFKIAAKKQS